MSLQGRYIWPNGDTFVGEFRHGRAHDGLARFGNSQGVPFSCPLGNSHVGAAHP